MQENGCVNTSPTVMAELCSTLILGRLKSGEFLWEEEGYWKNGYTYEVNPNITSDREWIRKGIMERNEIVVGGTTNPNLFSDNEEIIFTNKGLYLLGESGNANWNPYVGISDVVFINRGRKSFQICLTNGDTTDLENAAEWDKMMGLSNMRLFLLLMARLIGESEYEFTEAELQKLQLVTLESLENRCIVDYL